MENKNEKQTSITFDNLKALSRIMQEKELYVLAGIGRDSKKLLEDFCKTVKASRPKVQPKPAKVETKQTNNAAAQTPAVKTVVFNNNNASRPSRGTPDNRNNRDAGKPMARGDRKDQAPRWQKDGKKPFDGQNKSPSSRTTSNRGAHISDIPDTFVTKDNRSFANKKSKKSFDDKHTSRDDYDSKRSNKVDKFRFDLVSFDDEEMEDDGIIHMGRIRSPKKKAKTFEAKVAAPLTSATITTENLTVKILSEKIGKPVSEIIKKFMLLGMMLNINSPIDFDTAELVASEFGIKLSRDIADTNEVKVAKMFEDIPLVDTRAPIVTVMGHVDHGKTSLLDYIKKTNIAMGEAGGITQHIGAYSITVRGKQITFIDTPGHAAFSAMRQRGAQVTDIAILIVAGDDGVMPQTIEAVKYIKEAKVPCIVAVNKIDKPGVNIEKIKTQLADYDLVSEEWGGDTIFVPISAKTGEGVDKLLDTITLVAEMNELKTAINAPAMGTVLESRVDKGRGIMATIIVKIGTLKIGDFIVCGTASGRVRGLINYQGENLKSAGPSMAVSVLGLTTLPNAGDTCYAVDEKFAKELVDERINKLKNEKVGGSGATQSLEDFLSTPQEQVLKNYNVLIKADVQGSSEALSETLSALKNEEVKVNVIRAGVGAINESDIIMANASGAVVIGFNVKPDPKAKQLAESSGVEIKFYKIIYEVVDFVSEAINKMLTPKYDEVVIGHVEVRQLFKISSVGVIAGSYVQDGEVKRTSKARIMRGGKLINTCDIESLQQGKEQAKKVAAGFECGIKLKDFDEVMVGDILEIFELVEVKR